MLSENKNNRVLPGFDCLLEGATMKALAKIPSVALTFIHIHILHVAFPLLEKSRGLCGPLYLLSKKSKKTEETSVEQPSEATRACGSLARFDVTCC